jgi:hypothetical protein
MVKPVTQRHQGLNRLGDHRLQPQRLAARWLEVEVEQFGYH